MAKNIDIAKDRLYGENGLDASNIKLFTGSDRDSTAEQMADQVNRAIAQIENGDFEEVGLD